MIAAVGEPNAPDPGQPHPRGHAEEAEEEPVLGDQDEHRQPRLGDRAGEQTGDQQAQDPVDHQRAEPPHQWRRSKAGRGLSRPYRTRVFHDLPAY